MTLCPGPRITSQPTLRDRDLSPSGV
jgi:hypothetical protein